MAENNAVDRSKMTVGDEVVVFAHRICVRKSARNGILSFTNDEILVR